MTLQNTITNKEGNMKGKKVNDFILGYKDRMNGYYDKWYRYNRADDGAEYDRGCVQAIDDGAVKTEQFILIESTII